MLASCTALDFASCKFHSRLAFYGRLVFLLDPTSPEELSQLKTYKLKSRTGTIERIQPDGVTAIVRNLIKKDTDVSIYSGLQVRGEVMT